MDRILQMVVGNIAFLYYKSVLLLWSSLYTHFITFNP